MPKFSEWKPTVFIMVKVALPVNEILNATSTSTFVVDCFNFVLFIVINGDGWRSEVRVAEWVEGCGVYIGFQVGDVESGVYHHVLGKVKGIGIVANMMNYRIRSDPSCSEFLGGAILLEV